MAAKNAGFLLFAIAAALLLIAALMPVFRGGPINVAFLGAAVVFFIVALARRGRPPASPPGPSA